jgi:hypothetical protein
MAERTMWEIKKLENVITKFGVLMLQFWYDTPINVSHWPPFDVSPTTRLMSFFQNHVTLIKVITIHASKIGLACIVT